MKKRFFKWFDRYVLRRRFYDREQMNDLANDIKLDRKDLRKMIADLNESERKVFKILHDSIGGDEEMQALFHRLNYQRVVDRMGTSIKWWKWSILIFSLVSITGLYIWANYYEPLITEEHGLSEYESLIESVDHEINYHKEYNIVFLNSDSTEYRKVIKSIERNKEPNLSVLESVSESYFNVYFLRYILIRIVMITILITLITAGIKVYMRMRKDRMVLTVKEEGTTTTLYLFQKFLSVKDKEEYSPEEKKLIAEMLPSIISELYYIPSSKEVSKEKFSISHKLMSIMEKMATNPPRDHRGKN